MLACNPWLTLEEAREKELELDWCKVVDKEHTFFWKKNPTIMKKIYWSMDDDFLYFLHYRWDPTIKISTKEILLPEKYKILWLPPTLSRVLTALEKIYNTKKDLNLEYIKWYIVVEEYDWYGYYMWDIRECKRNLLKEDGNDCTLFDQSQETQDILYSIICKDA